MKITATFILLIFLTGCTKDSTKGMNKTAIPQIDPPTDQLSYLALGDSYTIGEQVMQSESFPYQLRVNLSKQALNLAVPKVIATTGWTTGELIAGIKAETLAAKYDLVTLLIGVNNQYRGNSIDLYRTEFRELLKTAIIFAGGNTAHVFVVSIPDWGATAYAKQSGRDVQIIAKEIDAFNAVNKEETLKAGVSYTDITLASRKASADAALITTDGLHPSGKMYKEWVENLSPSVIKAFK